MNDRWRSTVLGRFSPLVYLSSNWVSRVGVVMVTTGAVLWLLLLPVTLRGIEHPYFGIVTFLLLPTCFFLGLLLIPLGIFRRWRQERRKGTYPAEFPPLDFKNVELRRLLTFVALISLVNLLIGAQFIYSSMSYMDSVTFCGKTDDKRQVIPWVSHRDVDGSVSEYVATDTPPKPELLSGGKRRVMDCIDCHNRPTHRFDLPESAVNRAMGAGRISPALPFAHKVSVELLKKNYASQLAEQTEMPEAFREYYRKNYFATYNTQRAQVEQAAATLLGIHNNNVFPSMNVTSGTYPNNVGHNDFPDCFRCHDGNHQTKGGQTISQDCNSCHSLLAMDEANPKILEELYGK